MKSNTIFIQICKKNSRIDTKNFGNNTVVIFQLLFLFNFNLSLNIFYDFQFEIQYI